MIFYNELNLKQSMVAAKTLSFIWQNPQFNFMPLENSTFAYLLKLYILYTFRTFCQAIFHHISCKKSSHSLLHFPANLSPKTDLDRNWISLNNFFPEQRMNFSPN